jgi:hypothetical protein
MRRKGGGLFGSSSGITDVVPEFLETGCRGVFHHLMYLRHLQTMLDIPAAAEEEVGGGSG